MNRKNNIEFITDLMEYSKTGAMMHVFVLSAIDKYADQIIAVPEDQEPNWAMVNFKSLRAAAVEAKAALEGRLEKRSETVLYQVEDILWIVDDNTAADLPSRLTVLISIEEDSDPEILIASYLTKVFGYTFTNFDYYVIEKKD